MYQPMMERNRILTPGPHSSLFLPFRGRKWQPSSREVEKDCIITPPCSSLLPFRSIHQPPLPLCLHDRMKFYEHSFNYDYTFPAVALAYFLRYPNPYSRHVLSSDVIDCYIDPETGRLHTVRLHLKKSKVPSAILKFLPRSIAGPGGTSQSYVLEKSTIDVKEGWMETESKNMEWTGILNVIEKKTYRRKRPEMFSN